MIKIDLTYSQYTMFGDVLRHMYYSNESLISLAPNQKGYPHNGGEHTLYISGSKDECSAYIELIKETYPNTSAIMMNKVLSELESGNTNIKLSSLFPDH